MLAWKFHRKLLRNFLAGLLEGLIWSVQEILIEGSVLIHSFWIIETQREIYTDIYTHILEYV